VRLNTESLNTFAIVYGHTQKYWVAPERTSSFSLHRNVIPNEVDTTENDEEAYPDEQLPCSPRQLAETVFVLLP
jgi:hypothetical protein